MNEYGCVSLGTYIGTATTARRAHLAVSMGIFDPTISGGTFPAAPTGTFGISIMSEMFHSILGG